ncbi:MAG: YgiT-type zinc finger protein [Nitrospinae bacterium]|nr:YgiT-type zinc finger protein [Nitrospinota bacterium]
MPKKERLCPECRGIVKSGKTELVYELSDIKITVKNVTANVCSKCGQSFVSGRVAEDVNRLVNRITEDLNSFIKTQPHIGEGHKEIAIAV